MVYNVYDFGLEEGQKIPIKRINDEGSRIYDCPLCQTAEVEVKDNVFYGQCPICKGTLIDYVPLKHQEAFHQSNAQYRMNIGGFGSGKTTASCAELASHGLSTPNGASLITAPTLTQVKDAVLPELDKFIPPWFITKKTKNPSPYYKLTNGHTILVYSSADQEKLRSLNLTAFYIEEASGVSYSIFDQLMTRLRNKAGVIRDKKGNETGYKFMGIISSNPEEGWIKDKFLLVSSTIIGSPSVDVNVYKRLIRKDKNRHFHTFISSSRDNEHIPAQFIERMSAGKNERWIRKYIDCYLDIKEGAVYPDFSKYIIEPFEIPQEWGRLGGFDPGFNDPTAFLSAAVDPKKGDIYVYVDYYVREQPVGYHAKHIKPLVDPYKFLFPIQADPSVEKRNERDLKTYKQYFFDLSDIWLESANNDILYGVEKVRDYMYSGKLHIFETCENLKEEATKYIYPEQDKANSEKPVDKNNHLMDALRYMIAKLPQNPNDMAKIYYKTMSKKGKDSNISSVFAGDTIAKKDHVFKSSIYKKRF